MLPSLLSPLLVKCRPSLSCLSYVSSIFIFPLKFSSTGFKCLWPDLWEEAVCLLCFGVHSHCQRMLKLRYTSQLNEEGHFRNQFPNSRKTVGVTDFLGPIPQDTFYSPLSKFLVHFTNEAFRNKTRARPPCTFSIQQKRHLPSNTKEINAERRVYKPHESHEWLIKDVIFLEYWKFNKVVIREFWYGRPPLWNRKEIRKINEESDVLRNRTLAFVTK